MLKKNAVIYALSANVDLAKEVAKGLGVDLGKVRLSHFPSGEVLACPEDTVRVKQVFIIQSTCPPVNDNLMELLIFFDALSLSSAKLVADLFSAAGANRIVTFDLHAAQIQGFFSCIEDDLSAVPFLGHVILHDESIDKSNLVTVSPDHGGVNRARRIAEKLNTPIAIIDKRRNAAYQPEVMNIIGDVRGKNCLIVDDMVDTAGSIVAAAKALKDNGAKEVMMACTHPVLSDPAYERLTQAKVFSKIYVTDSIPLPKKFANNPDFNIHVCSLAPIIANAITAINTDSSVSHAYDMYKE